MATNYLGKAITVKLDRLYPDPNNPRLGLDDAPGYSCPEHIFAKEVRDEIFSRLGDGSNSIDDLVDAIVGQGWLPVDNILVWKPKDEQDNWVVVEGNRRRLALERIRTDVLPKAKRRAERIAKNSGQHTKQELGEAKAKLAHIKKIVKETSSLQVMPVNASTEEELAHTLPRVLAVRHITGAKKWGYYAEDLWLLQRYSHLLSEAKGPDAGMIWDEALIQQVADEACLGLTSAKRQLKAVAWFSAFKGEWEDELPEGEEFKDTDYYLFALIAKYPWIRQQLAIADDATRIPKDMERVLFDWTWKEPRPKSADDNENVFYRHENIKVWANMAKYDQKPENNTSFASRFDVEDHESAPRMHEVEAEWMAHKARRKPTAVLDELIRKMRELGAESLVNEGEYFKGMLSELKKLSSKYLKMIAAAEG